MSADNGLLIWRDGHGTFRLAWQQRCAGAENRDALLHRLRRAGEGVA